MARLCRVCSDTHHREIDADLLAHQVGYRVISARWNIPATSLQRHAATHLLDTLRHAEETRQMLDAQALAARLLELEADVDWARERGKQTDDPKIVLLAVAQGRGNVELLTKLALDAEIERRLTALEEAHANGDNNGALEAPSEAGDGAGDTSTRLRALLTADDD